MPSIFAWCLMEGQMQSSSQHALSLSCEFPPLMWDPCMHATAHWHDVILLLVTTCPHQPFHRCVASPRWDALTVLLAGAIYQAFSYTWNLGHVTWVPKPFVLQSLRNVSVLMRRHEMYISCIVSSSGMQPRSGWACGQQTSLCMSSCHRKCN